MSFNIIHSIYNSKNNCCTCFFSAMSNMSLIRVECLAKMALWAKTISPPGLSFFLALEALLAAMTNRRSVCASLFRRKDNALDTSYNWKWQM